MSSTNDQLPPPPKPRLSPLEFRNTDLVSRLLAATPPYLYNMSLLSNTYFFSEMLRSFVQAKTDKNASQQHHLQQRRSRKRNWTVARAECFQKAANTETKKEERPDTADWMIKSNKKMKENPSECPKPQNSETLHYQAKEESPVIAEPIFPPSDTNQQQNLVLPPHPNMWYPPLYPTSPYGIDPLHFFIDLRVSGHIYDRKIQKETTLASPAETDVQSRERLSQTSLSASDVKTEMDKESNLFRQPRHCSAFSVPISNYRKTASDPINLCEKESKTSKFDVKSMGFDKSTNKTSSTYVMSNIDSIYKNIIPTRHQEAYDAKEIDVNIDESEEDKKKKVKDLRALIGLELVVDYMKQKPIKNQSSDSLSSTDIESVGSPALEVVAIHDEN